MTSTFEREMKDLEFKKEFDKQYTELCQDENRITFTLVDLGIQELNDGMKLFLSVRLSIFIDSNKKYLLEGVEQVIKSCKDEGKEITETRQQILDFLNLEFNKE